MRACNSAIVCARAGVANANTEKTRPTPMSTAATFFVANILLIFFVLTFDPGELEARCWIAGRSAKSLRDFASSFQFPVSSFPEQRSPPFDEDVNAHCFCA